MGTRLLTRGIFLCRQKMTRSKEIHLKMSGRSSQEKSEEEMVCIIVILMLLAGACVVQEIQDWYRGGERRSVLKYLLLLSGMFMLTGCLSFTTTERTDHTVPVDTVMRTETVYVNENGTRVRRVVTVDSLGRRYYVENGQTVYVNHYEY
jgi:hypothetical protein